MSRELPHLLWLRLLLVGSFILLPCLSSGQETHFDTFFCIDVSASMVGEGGNEDFLNVFEEVQQRVTEDIQSRRPGDTVFLFAFSGPPTDLIPGGQGRTIQSQTDKTWLVNTVSELEATGTTTYLYYTYMEVLDRALQWHEAHPDHFIDIRVYTDGKNAGPPSPTFDDVLERIRAAKGDVEHLTVFHIPFVQPGEEEQVRTTMMSEAERIEEAGGLVGSVSDLFVRIAPQHLDLGNMRSTGGTRDFSLVVYFDAAADGRSFSCEPILTSLSSDPPDPAVDLLFNVHPRPVSVSDQAIRQTIEIVTPATDLPEDADISFSGDLQLSADGQGVSFLPPSIGFSGRYSPVRVVSMFVDGHAEARRCDSAMLISTRDAPLFTNEAPEPVYLSFDVVSADLLHADEEIQLDVHVRDSDLRGFAVASFVPDMDDVGEGSTTASITRGTEELILRVHYPHECLRGIQVPGYYPIELSVSLRGEDLSLEVGALSDPSARTRGTDVVRVFPGPIPSDADWDAQLAAPELVPPDPCVRFPPPLWLKWVAAVVMGAIAFAVLRFMSLPKISCATLAAVYVVISGLWGSWPSLLALPSGGNWIFLGWVAAAVVHVFLPWPFALTPFSGGWKLDLTGSLRKEALTRGRRSFSDHWSRNSLAFGMRKVSQGEDDVDIGASSTQFRLTCSKLWPSGKPRLLAIADGIKVDGQRVRSGEVIVVGHHSSIKTRQKNLTVL